MRKVFVAVICLLILSACGPVPSPTVVLPTSTPEPSPSPTATIVWFPPTATATERPEILSSPTPDMRTGIGKIFFEEPFDNPEDWEIFPVQGGSSMFSNGHLTMVLDQKNQYAYATHNHLFIYNFYGEITAKPNLCEAADEYGVILRTVQLQDFYRLAISCGGSVSVSRSSEGSTFSVIPNSPIPGQQTGPPGSVKIGFWANNTEIRFFINDQFLFSTQDIILRSGTLGVFIHSVSDATVSVNFSDLSLFEIDAE
ncbi:MAG: hypothetical protein HON98_13400 [Chloroflexi bacterium]|jgi:hypothetical protein|nr:hypothetical protein [Chloroflexota bacterium]MBT3669202.1 hypothetical protein [Chloroflexota bacterium]MBT4003057.1 hypothetical protein [Chloroflexota bacterium]MBT4306447.1 hypothetical protein [Chloroflexota bacterium]MBT4534946.1 hypothetical protein [Chloroflexota bacterium]